MEPPLRLHDVSPPDLGSGAYGRLRCATLDARLTGEPALLPRAAAPSLLAWVDGVCGPAPRGLDIASVPAPWRAALRWAGMPLVADGELRWGVDLVAGEVTAPHVGSRSIVLPPPERLAGCSGPQLRPLRALVAHRLGVDLRSAPGVQLYVWSDRALVVSTVDLPVGGFLHGPQPGSRQSLSLPPGGFQAVRW